MVMIIVLMHCFIYEYNDLLNVSVTFQSYKDIEENFVQCSIHDNHMSVLYVKWSTKVEDIFYFFEKLIVVETEIYITHLYFIKSIFN